jgi:predicted GNAT family acetyltransferase
MAIQVKNNESEFRYEAAVEGGVAFAEYDLDGDVITFTHTEVPSEAEGQGVASTIVTFALDDARKRKLKVVPVCAYVVSYMKRHPEYDDLRHEA